MNYNQCATSIQTTPTFDRWFSALHDRNAKARIQMRIDRAELGNFGDCVPVGEGVSEMRIHTGGGYRIYYVQRKNKLIVLLAGGNKSTQCKDITIALKLARQI